jgi:hypothetical protein
VIFGEIWSFGSGIGRIIAEKMGEKKTIKNWEFLNKQR